ncbi:MAG: class I SAM-dependent methyltransferase [Rhodospirillaceae bacterium]|nr:class I SAM-dependent methyltransferase [Rhodospirillaceae bacterium]
MSDYTPALGYRWLTPLYDSAIALLTRERHWRRLLLAQAAPRAGDRILDVGCGTGTFALMLKQACPAAEVMGIDPDPEVLARARAKAAAAGADIAFVAGFVPEMPPARLNAPTKIVSSLVFHQIPLEGKRGLLRAIRALLADGGELHIADYGAQRSRLMRALFRGTVQVLDGTADTQPNADGVLPQIMRDAGFASVEETRIVPTATGSISLLKAR